MTFKFVERLPNGTLVSTTRLPEQIAEYKYETVVTPPFTDVAVYETQAEAKAGHQAMVEKWTEKADEDACRTLAEHVLAGYERDVCQPPKNSYPVTVSGVTTWVDVVNLPDDGEAR